MQTHAGLSSTRALSSQLLSPFSHIISNPHRGLLNRLWPAQHFVLYPSELLFALVSY